MSHHPDQFFSMGGSDQYDPAFAMYDSQYQPSFSRLPGPPAHFDGVAFWYRPEPQDPVFDQQKRLYSQNMATNNGTLEPPVNIKHRRTRSGCFTCRHRRVKCDETRPVCERCKKGNRECHFPQQLSSSRKTDIHDPRNVQHARDSSRETKRQSSRNPLTIDDESSEEEEDEEDEEIPDTTSPTLISQPQNTSNVRFKGNKYVDSRRMRQQAPARASRERKSPVSSDAQSPQSRFEAPSSKSDASLHSQNSSAKSHRWKHLNPTMQEYLQFQQDNMTRYHYFLKLDPTDFIHNGFIDMALSFEPLLYAVVAFAAYHHTLRKEDGKFKEFWKYYCQSIMLLRKWLESHTERNEAVLFTVLQLTTFEEYLGDWANLASHHRAAHSIFNALYTYDNVMATAASRCIFDWLARTDVIAGLMAGATAVLSRTWFTTALEWHRVEMNQEAPDTHHAISYFVAKLRLVGFDMTAVFANAATNPRTMEDIQDVATQMDDLRVEMQSLHTANFSTRDIPDSQIDDTDSENAFDPRIPLFRDQLWPLNFIWLDWYGTQQMHKYQVVQLLQAMQARAMSQGQPVSLPTTPQLPDFSNLSPELENLSIVQCQIYEAIERYADAPPGAILGCQASLALSTLFLKREPKYIMWSRRKLANLERLGYIWPPHLRKRMSQMWNDDDILEWWLPHGEGKIPLLDEIRGVVEDRNKDIEGRGGDDRDSLREMHAIFEKMDFDVSAARARKDSVWSTGGLDAASTTSESGRSDEADELQHHPPRRVGGRSSKNWKK